MLVKYWMRTPAVTVDADAWLADAGELMQRHGVRMLPVQAGGRLVGVITRGALERATAAGSRTRVRRAMILDPVRFPLYHTVEEAALVLVERGVRAAPVTDPAGGVAGVVSAADLFRALGLRIGVHRKGVQVALRAADRPGVVQEVAERIHRHRGRIVSLLTRRGGSGGEGLEIYFRLHGLAPVARDRLMKEMRAHARVIYMVDHEAAEREITSKTTYGPTSAPNHERFGGTIEKGDNR